MDNSPAHLCFSLFLLLLHLKQLRLDLWSQLDQLFFSILSSHLQVKQSFAGKAESHEKLNSEMCRTKRCCSLYTDQLRSLTTFITKLLETFFGSSRQVKTTFLTGDNKR